MISPKTGLLGMAMTFTQGAGAARPKRSAFDQAGPQLAGVTLRGVPTTPGRGAAARYRSGGTRTTVICAARCCTQSGPHSRLQSKRLFGCSAALWAEATAHAYPDESSPQEFRNVLVRNSGGELARISSLRPSALAAFILLAASAAHAELPSPIGVSISDMKTGAIVIATGFVVAALAVAAIKFLREASTEPGPQGSAYAAGNDTFADDPDEAKLQYPELYSDDEVAQAIENLSERGGLVETAQHHQEFPLLFTPEQFDESIERTREG